MYSISCSLVPSGFNILQKSKPLLHGAFETVTVDPNKNFTVKVGTNSFVTDYRTLIKGFDMRRFVNYGHEYPIKIEVEKGKLFISAWITDKEGRMVAQLIDNEWRINPNNFYDRNFSNNAFEVIDNNKMPILQVVVKSGNEIDIGGIFYYPGGKIAITSKAFIVNPLDDNALKKEMRTIFKYPSNKFLGAKYK